MAAADDDEEGIDDVQEHLRDSVEGTLRLKRLLSADSEADGGSSLKRLKSEDQSPETTSKIEYLLSKWGLHDDKVMLHVLEGLEIDELEYLDSSEFQPDMFNWQQVAADQAATHVALWHERESLGGGPIDALLTFQQRWNLSSLFDSMLRDLSHKDLRYVLTHYDGTQQLEQLVAEAQEAPALQGRTEGCMPDANGLTTVSRFHRLELIHPLADAAGVVPLALLARGLTMAVPESSPYDCWERARVDPVVFPEQFAQVRTIFGYGSLIFRPGFQYKRRYPAVVHGFVRRFWQRSCDHRGTPEAPGRVLALLRDVDVDLSSEATAGVTGMAYEVEEEDWPAVLEALDIRERHGYTRTLTELYPTPSSSEVLGKAVVYCAHEPKMTAAYTGPEALEDTAKVIAMAKGPSGPNDEYLFALLDAMESNGLPEDPSSEMPTWASR
eukprot:symbB.v1.2.019533.t1/scaffold1599.1/size109767/3